MATTLFLGGARSGKSRLAQAAAEACLGDDGGPLHFLATAQAFDDEMRDRIARHRADRDARWTTVDCPIDLPEAIGRIGAGAILIDCLTLWLSNLMLGDRDIEGRTAALLAALAAAPIPVFLVSNEVGMGIVPDHPLGRRFRDAAGRLNQAVAGIADVTYLVVSGLVLPLQLP